MALQRLGPFELLRVLGRGGMGTVYEAREPGSKVLVAVKALAPSFSFDDHFRNRFEAEIEALMSLDHKNIVRLLSFGQDEGNLFFAMELVDGTSLYQEQKQGHVFHWRETIDIGIQICEGLQHAHNRGIIHRDLKPGNLMLATDGRVKITDFGIAKSFGSSSLTSEGNVIGTMDFMAPEQARGTSTNARSDLFSLGAVLYSLLVGRPPFLRDSVDKTFEALLSPDPPARLNKIAGDIPEPLAQVIHRLMEKDPARRIATAQATGRQLANVLEAVSSAKKGDTQILSNQADEFETANTRVVADHNTGHAEFGETSAKRETPQQATEAEAGKPRPSGAGESRLDTVDMRSQKADYFNKVTPQQRQKKAEFFGEDEIPSSIWPLLLALVVVVIISAVGVWFSLFRQPGKEELLAVIRAAELHPQNVQDEIRQFEKWYADEVEIDYVIGLRDRVEVTKYCNNLQARRKLSINNPLSQIESKFLAIYDRSRDSVPDALDQLHSFLRLYGESASLTTADSRVIEMAKQIKAHWSRESQKRIKEGRQFIGDALDRARKSGNRDDAMDLYKSIIDIYGNDAWAGEWVDEARAELKILEPQSD